MKKYFLLTTFTILLFLSFELPFPILAQHKDPLLTDSVKFSVNMSYMVANGTFNPSSDNVFFQGNQITDTVPFPMERSDTSYIYRITYVLYSGITYQYQFSFRHGDTVHTENVDPWTRLIRVRDSLTAVTNFFNNYNPASIAMTFNCDMYYQVKAGHFTPALDWVDVAGNFNNGGAYDVLYPVSKDSIYTTTVFLDTTLLQNPELKFRFRINGDSATEETVPDSTRTYTLVDTAENVFSCWYNNIDPRIPALPVAYDLAIQDTVMAKKIVSGIYSYEDYNLKPEGYSIYKWYRADSIGGALTFITDSTNSYTIDSAADIGKYLVFEVTPVTVDSVVGLPARVYSTKVVGVGIREPGSFIAKVYPNPVKDRLFIEPLQDIEKIEMLDITGQRVGSLQNTRPGKTEIDVSGFPSGIYFLRIYSKNAGYGTYKVILLK
jgi:hypothetical protein